jgi:hypothetical protein
MADRVRWSAEAAGRELLWLVVPWLLVVLVALVELSEEVGSAPNLRVGSLITPAPALAAIRGAPVRVVAVSLGALTVAVLTMIAGYQDGIAYHLTIIGAVLGVGLASWLASSGRVRREARLSQVQRIAEAAQLALLPPIPRRAGGVRLEARYVAAESEARIGGDLYEAVVERDHLRVIIGDVRGKGLPAVRTASAVLGAFREAAHHEPTLSEVALRCSEAVGRLEDDPGDAYGSHLDGDELFVTAVLVDIKGPRLQLVNLGHPPPLLLSSKGVHYLASEETQPPLGLAHVVSHEFPVYQREWQPGERLLLYTDGIDEARNPAGRFFPLPAVAQTLLDVPVESLPDRLLAAVDQHTGRRLLDDAAVVAVEWGAEDADGSASHDPVLRRLHRHRPHSHGPHPHRPYPL